MSLRPCHIEVGAQPYALGSALITLGGTKVLCTVSMSEGVPRFMKEQKTKGAWLTAEYGMLPSATHQRCAREAVRGKQSGRTQEIQRLIGRALRTCIDLASLPAMTLTIDCDVLQADGGTRMASVTGSCVALVAAVQAMQYKKLITHDPMRHMVSGISVGMVKGEACLDLSYELDSQADTDMNVVMTEHGDLIEVQSTAEGKPLTVAEFQTLLQLATEGNQALLALQRSALQLS